MVSIQIPNAPHGAQYGVFVLGIAIVGTAVWLLLAFGFRVDESSARPVGVALIWFGLLFAVAIADGRTSFGLSDTSTSRYVTFDLLILVGSYLVVLDRYAPLASKPIRRTRWLPGITAAVAALICLQVIFGTANGISDARQYRNYEVTNAIVLANIQRAPDGLVASLGAEFESPDFIRAMAHDARVLHLSLFSTADGAWYSRQSLPINHTPPKTSLLKPTAGEVLRGKLYVVASASDSFGITKLEFMVRGNGGTTVVIRGFEASYFYLGGWDTRTVPDGTYSIRSIAYSPGGLMGVSRWTVVTVAN